MFFSSRPSHREPEENFILAQNARRQLRIFLMTFIGVGFFAEQIMAQGIDSSAADVFHNSKGLYSQSEFDRPNVPNEHSRPDDPNQIRRYSATGKPCIALQSFVTAQLINKSIYEHWIKASNSCGQNIRIQVCYHKTDDCIVMNVPPYENKNAVLGIRPSTKEFRYDAKEK